MMNLPPLDLLPCAMLNLYVVPLHNRKGRYSMQQGQGLVEYALILALVALVVVGALVIFGPQIGDIFSSITAGL